MAVNKNWKDEYWLLFMQLYLKKPTGIKPLYSRDMVNLSLETHLHPKYIYRKMFLLRRLATPRIEKLWNTYSGHPKKLAKGVNMLRMMYGFNNADSFYEGVEINESFEADFKPIPGHEDLTPIMLIMILDLYFRLTPITMVEETPEIIELAQKMKINGSRIVEIMHLFQTCDPCLRHATATDNGLLPICQQMWQKYGNDEPDKLATYAAQLNEYFK